QDTRYVRHDLTDEPQGNHKLENRIEVLPATAERTRKAYVARFHLSNGNLLGSEFLVQGDGAGNGSQGGRQTPGLQASFGKILRAKLPLAMLKAGYGDTLLLRLTLFREQLTVASLPAQGWIAIALFVEEMRLDT